MAKAKIIVRGDLYLFVCLICLYRDKLGKLVESLNQQLTDKGAEINGYMEKHQIQVKGQGSDVKKVRFTGSVTFPMSEYFRPSWLIGWSALS